MKKTKKMKKTMKDCIVEKRGEIFVAYLKNNTKIWGAGKTIPEAVCDVILHHPKKFGVNIRLPI